MKQSIAFTILLSLTFGLRGQDSNIYTLKLSYPVLDLPQNTDRGYYYPSMMQSVALSGDLYDVSFWGIHALGKTVLPNRKGTKFGSLSQDAATYLMGLAFAKYGSQLPIPLGVFTHEEFHRSVLRANGYSSINGNWTFNRWDGTVYGVTDEALTALKAEDVNGLLYSYVSGVQSETYLTQVNVMQDFYYKRTFYKAPLYLYNAYYVWDYFKFATSASSDSVKVDATPHESADPFYRDYAGNDLTAWIYDMYSPDSAYTNRDLFPGGEGANRRIGFSELNADGQDFLENQKKLSLLNFINPAIFFVNRIHIGERFCFLPFMQYHPTHFGNDIALVVPFITGGLQQNIALHRYRNQQKSFFGVQYGVSDLNLFADKNLLLSAQVLVWSQPEDQSFFDTKGQLGGNVEVQADYHLDNHFSFSLALGFKTDGWLIANPYLKETFSLRAGIGYNLVQYR